MHLLDWQISWFRPNLLVRKVCPFQMFILQLLMQWPFWAGPYITRGDYSGGGEYSYTRVLPDGFFFESDCFYGIWTWLYEYSPPPPPQLSRLDMALLLGNALYEFSMKRREKCLNLRSPVGISLCVATVNRLLPGCLVTSSRKVFEILHKLNVCVLSNFPTNKRLTVTADLPRRRLIAILVL
jgi:hypothetical protein